MLLTGTMFKIQLTNQVEVNSEDISVTFNDVKGVSLFNIFIFIIILLTFVLLFFWFTWFILVH